MLTRSHQSPTDITDLPVNRQQLNYDARFIYL